MPPNHVADWLHSHDMTPTAVESTPVP